ncbi:unnamed protein product [Phaedon cochleariae]|uniref:Uncharacterized protein n=1 Tax=Phaedon cochleariae TaxID=80249 RepID=A0A9N9SFJ4_PHACE|nr:unnamed protein product [Phaedon cochleariae]
MSDLTKEYVAKMFHDLTTQIQLQNNQLATQISDLRDELKNFKGHVVNNIRNLEEQNEGLKLETQALKERLQNTERKAKKYNLIIYNLPGTNPCSLVVKLFRDNLNVNCQEEDFRDVYRFNSTNENKKPGPILVEFVSNILKTKILSEAKKLKNTGIYISLDYTPEDYQRKKVLLAYQKTVRSKGKTASIKGQSLVIEGITYTLDELTSNEESVAVADLDERTGSKQLDDTVFKVDSKKRIQESQQQAEEYQPRKQKYLRSTSTSKKSK